MLSETNLQLLVVANAKRFAVGEKPELSLSIRNQSNKTIYLVIDGNGMSIQTRYKTQKGTANNGGQLFGSVWSNRAGWAKSKQAQPLPPGKSIHVRELVLEAPQIVGTNTIYLVVPFFASEDPNAEDAQWVQSTVKASLPILVQNQ